MRKNKKSQVLVYGLIFGLLLAIATFYMAYYLKILPKDYLGENSLIILKAGSEAEKTSLYIRLSAQYASEDSIIQLAEKGGFDSAKCGENKGYNLMNNDLGSCFPDYESNLKSIFARNLDLYLSKYPKDIPREYEIELKDSTKFNGKAISTINIKGKNLTSKQEPLMEYKIIPYFSSEVDFDLNIFEGIKTKAAALISLCEKEAELEKCISQNSNWNIVEVDSRTVNFDIDSQKKVNGQKIVIKIALYFPDSISP